MSGSLEIDVQGLDPRARYQLLTSLVVPRPIAWVSTWSRAGHRNLAPFSYFAALSANPALVGVSIGARKDGEKDTLVNIRDRRAFCVNVVTERHLEAMNRTSAEVGPEVDEFDLVGLPSASSARVDAPYVVDCPAVLECLLRQEVPLEGSRNVLVIGEVVGVRLDPTLPCVPETASVDPHALRPVGRLSGSGYSLQGAVRLIPRP